MSTVRRTTAGWLVVTVLALVAGTVGLARPAGAADGTCDGVWVVVDARAHGGEMTTRCAPGDPSSGLDALKLTGHSYSFVPRFPGMVCTIDARPDPCNGAPTNAYWGYFHAEAGGEWEYANYGAGNRDPEPGTVEGWAFGDDARPGRRPPSNEPAPAPSPSPTQEPAASPAPEPTRAPVAPATAEPSASAAPSASSTAAPTDTPTEDPAEGSAEPSERPTEPEPSATASPAAAGESGAAPLTEPSPSERAIAAGPPDEDDPAPVGPIVGGVLVAGIAGAAVVRSRRRDDGQV